MAKKKSIQQEVDANENPNEVGMEHFMKIKKEANVKQPEVDTSTTPCDREYNQGSIAEKKHPAPQPWKPKGRK